MWSGRPLKGASLVLVLCLRLGKECLICRDDDVIATLVEFLHYVASVVVMSGTVVEGLVVVVGVMVVESGLKLAIEHGVNVLQVSR